jgi:CBS domain-containing protein
MTVSTILAGKGREVVSVEPSASLADAVRLLAGKRIGAAVILGADRRIAGIISERDIVRVLAERGAGALDEPVSQTMTRKVETCNESETVSSLMERMTSGKFRNVDAEPRDGRHHVGARAVAHRCCVQQRVARRNRVDLGGIGVARGRENAVREHGTLGPTVPDV